MAPKIVTQVKWPWKVRLAMLIAIIEIENFHAHEIYHHFFSYYEQSCRRFETN